ncbi:MAG TPA: phosphatidylserine decarboxylase [Spirochaetes bacterium]|nr:phosphatidylserine decarboxylase [Spirochaetota bacterium]
MKRSGCPLKGSDTLVFLFKIIPTGLISRVFGWIARIPLPGFILSPVIGWYCGKFGVNRDEISDETPFKNLDQFFTRKLKSGTRPIDGAPRSIVSPVDAKVEGFGAIDGTSIMQAKGIDYSLSDLLPSDYHRHFIDGSFMTLYLSPGDYHRIHSPVDGQIEGYYALPGKLYTVQEFMVRGVKGLYSLNERLISYIHAGSGRVAVCMIGAMNVGRISFSHADVETNGCFKKRTEYFFPEDRRPVTAKGDELGIFHLGSTIILLFQKGSVKIESPPPGTAVRFGSVIGRFI